MRKAKSNSNDLIQPSRTLLKCCLAIAGCFGALPHTYATEALAKQHACMGCHSISEKVVGPAFKEIAKRYESVAGSEAILMAAIRNGSINQWGKIAMPGNDKLTEAQARSLAAYVLQSGKL
jgi:cytochrome c